MREAHPSDNSGDPRVRQGPNVASAKSQDDRAAAAARCVSELKLTIPVLLDDMDGAAEKAYRGWPARTVVVDIDGVIAFATPPSPNGVDPAAAATALRKLLANGGRRPAP